VLETAHGTLFSTPLVASVARDWHTTTSGAATLRRLMRVGVDVGVVGTASTTRVATDITHALP
jgi:hypothetical protein